jgi:hypothetical protein
MAQRALGVRESLGLLVEVGHRHQHADVVG